VREGQEKKRRSYLSSPLSVCSRCSRSVPVLFPLPHHPSNRPETRMDARFPPPWSASVPGVPGRLCTSRPFLFAGPVPGRAATCRPVSFLVTLTAANAARSRHRHRPPPGTGKLSAWPTQGLPAPPLPRTSLRRNLEGKLDGQGPAQGRAMRAGQDGAHTLAGRGHGPALCLASLTVAGAARRMFRRRHPRHGASCRLGRHRPRLHPAASRIAAAQP
jgi:hypothetical protein